MKKIILPIAAILVVGLVGLSFRHSLFSDPGVLEIITTPSTQVVINGEALGTTPFKREMSPQRVEVKLLSSDDGQQILWQGGVSVVSSALTLIKYQFESSQQQSYGEILTFSKIPDKNNGALLVSSFPDRAIVNLDGETKGYTPILLENVPSGRHNLELSLAGHENTVIGLNVATGFQLNAEIKMAKLKEVVEEENVNLPSDQERLVTILATSTGWLRVRSGPGTQFPETARINPGGQYPLLEEEGDWLKIALEEDKEGWISAQYGEIVEVESL